MYIYICIMYVCMHVCMYACMNECMYMCICVCIFSTCKEKKIYGNACKFEHSKI